MTQQRRKDCITSACMCVFWGLMLWYVLPTYVDSADGYDNTALPPSFWPHLVIIFGFICSISLFIVSTLYLWRGKKAERPKINWLNEGRGMLLMGLLCVYMYGIEYLGLLAMSALFLPMAAWLYGERRPLALILFSLCTTAVLYVFFVRIAQVQIPSGLWFTT